MPVSVSLILCLAAFCGGLTQGLAGFGSTLVALPLLAQVMDLRLATPVCCLLALAVNIVLTSRLRGHIQWPSLGILLGASLPGMVLGARALDSLPGWALKAALGLAVLAFVAHAFWRRGTVGRAGPGAGLTAGFVAGCLGAAIGVNGPPVVAWVSRQGFDRNAVRATLTAYFLLAGIGVVGAQYGAGLLTPEVVRRAALGLPALLLGLAAGMAGCGRIGERGFARVVLGLLGVTGLTLILQALGGLWAG